jgi:L-seryl-tRNA(Ser) seleniumtransferase
LLARPKKEIEAAARRLLPIIAAKIGDGFDVAVTPCVSQIGSGALPMETVPSAGLAIRPRAAKHGGRLLTALSMALRRLPVPVVGRIEDKALFFDLRCLDGEDAFIANLATLDAAENADAMA